MKRDEFIKLISIGSGGFLLGNAKGAISNFNYEIKDTVIYDNYLNGVKHRETDFIRIQPREGEVVQLEREESNPYDFYAVRIVIRGAFIGYLPAHENIAIANMLDAGVRMKGVVSKINKDPNDHYLQNSIAVRISTELLAPAHKIEKSRKWEQADDAIDVYRQGPKLL